MFRDVDSQNAENDECGESETPEGHYAETHNHPANAPQRGFIANFPRTGKPGCS